MLLSPGDLKHSLRVLLSDRWFSFGAIAILAIGIGANTAIFSVVNAVVLKPLDVPEEKRIVQFRVIYPAFSSPIASPRQFNMWRVGGSVFDSVSAYWLAHVNLVNDSERELEPAALVTSDFFSLYGARVLYGRTFTREEDRPQGGHVVVLSHRLWSQRFRADPAVIGRSVVLGGVPFVIVGVLGSGFNSEQFDEIPRLWLPFQIDENSDAKDGRLCYVTGRLKPGVTLQTARARLQLVADDYARRYPQAGLKTGFTVLPLREGMTGEIRTSLLLLVASVALVLMLACANLANLLLVRAVSRQREVAIRASLGASRWRLASSFLTESILLSLTGGSLGLLAGIAGIRTVLKLLPSSPLGVPTNPNSIPRIGESGSAVGMDWRVTGFAILLCLITGILFGLIPAWKASRADINSQLKSTGSRSGIGVRDTRTLSFLAMSEVSAAVVLLIGAALLIRTEIALQEVNPGFELRHVLTAQMSLVDSRLQEPSAIDRMVRKSVERINALPGVVSAAVSCCLPLETKWQLAFIVEGRPLNGRFHGIGAWTFISPGYFDSLQIPLLRGREFTDSDGSQAPGVVMINDAMANAVWPGKDPIGEHLLLGRGTAPEFEADPVRQIVGIVGSVRDDALNRNPRPEMYVPIAQLPDPVKALDLPLLPVAWLVRTRGEPRTFAPAVERELKEVSDLPIARIRSLQEIREQSIGRTRFQMWLMVLFGGLALLLAGLGTYSVIAYAVRLRTPEIGVRIALGAPLHQVRNTVMYQGMRLALAGIFAGLAASCWLAQLLTAFLYGVKPHDTLIFVAVALFMMGVVLVAVWRPAQQATHVDPIEVLKSE